MFYCHLSAFSRQTVYNKIISSWQYPLIIRMTIAIVHSIVSLWSEGSFRYISLHFILSPTSLLSSFPVQVSIRFVTSYQNSCATYGNDCAQPLKWLCKVLGTVVPLRWHSRAKGVAQACQRGGTSKAYLLLLVRYAFSALQAYLQRDSLSSSQTGITAWYGWQ